MTYTLLTGATGLIGRYLLKDLLLQGRPVAIILRGTNTPQRVNDLFHDIQSLDDVPLAANEFQKVMVLPGDLLDPNLGLSLSHRAWIASHVGDVIHCAGDVNFQSNGLGSSTWDTNVDGSCHLARFCKSQQIEDFSYVSTAFVCGDRSGTIYESELDCGQGFASLYEKSKFQAELHLRELGFDRLSIFRPCFVSGDSASGYTSTYHGIYWFAQFTALAQMRANVPFGQPWHHDVRIFKNPNERHHMIPVDAVSKAIVELHTRPELGSATYHLTPSRATSLGEIERALCESFQYQGVRFAECVAPSAMNEMESLFYEGLRATGHRYLDGDPAFDCSQTRQSLPWWDSIQIDHAYLLRIFDFAQRHRYGKGKKRRPKALTA